MLHCTVQWNLKACGSKLIASLGTGKLTLPAPHLKSRNYEGKRQFIENEYLFKNRLAVAQSGISGSVTRNIRFSYLIIPCLSRVTCRKQLLFSVWAKTSVKSSARVDEYLPYSWFLADTAKLDAYESCNLAGRVEVLPTTDARRHQLTDNGYTSRRLLPFIKSCRNMILIKTFQWSSTNLLKHFIGNHIRHSLSLSVPAWWA